MNKVLLPCPFCGTEACLEYLGATPTIKCHSIMCRTRMSSGRECDKETKEEIWNDLVGRWNSRIS